MVGDYEQHYKFQTPINQAVESAIAHSHVAVKFVASLLKQCFEVATGAPSEDSEFREKMFNSSMMNAAMKLQLIISRRVTDPDLTSYIRRCLTQELLTKMVLKAKDDEKLEKIILAIQKQVHPPKTGSNEEETKEQANVADQKESAEAKKAAFAKKK
jgi:predicted phage tail protein